MNNSWWQEFARFFLQGITLNRLVYMLVILIALVIFTPLEVKEWVNSHNPELIPDYWMYYVLLACLSYILSSAVSATYSFCKPFCIDLLNFIYKKKAERYIDRLSEDEKDFLCMFLEMKNPKNKFARNNQLIVGLVQKGVLVDLGYLPYENSQNLYCINEYYYSIVVMKLSNRWSN